MKKLKLNLDDIRVTSVELVAPDADGAGTVKGAEDLTRWTYCGQESCWATCEVDCV